MLCREDNVFDFFMLMFQTHHWSFTSIWICIETDNFLPGLGIRVMVFKATFNYISIISWRSVLLVEETGVPGKNHWPVASHWQTLSHNVVWVHLDWAGFELITSVVIGTDGKGSCKSKYHTITTTTAPLHTWFNAEI